MSVLSMFGRNIRTWAESGVSFRIFSEVEWTNVRSINRRIKGNYNRWKGRRRVLPRLRPLSYRRRQTRKYRKQPSHDFVQGVWCTTRCTLHAAMNAAWNDNATRCFYLLHSLYFLLHSPSLSLFPACIFLLD